ncbi:hydrogenase maturation nickel metallochaperone HypA/HybF [Capillimicrobium parvum]|uniref:Hydrogenase maturation factor HypA n=1 Tax=Capillimicrobium parvum TaxID=2884022 RepID=A0A9E7C1W4_9ACTN|nr:hydrogenase maturation nickel metallochaperone HypA [Capillimicrobium parvum]UGS37017.1 Hydrogenase maturation factor HybF [Capillimicrobium parvum]
MHELSIAEAIVRIADAHAAGRRVMCVEVAIGHLRQVVPSALEFAFELVAVGTAVEGAELDVVTVPAEGRCRACATVTVLDGFPLHCAACGGLDLQLLRGEELRVESLELDETTMEGVGSGD